MSWSGANFFDLGRLDVHDLVMNLKNLARFGEESGDFFGAFLVGFDNRVELVEILIDIQ